ncbi:MAG: M20/M25/M40 family metallo-hydrolase [Deltaproteobacteria bacterium]|nr:M20/M25/M40 family metallo-hydrolase [Deltaproteobacteria bacterium]
MKKNFRSVYVLFLSLLFLIVNSTVYADTEQDVLAKINVSENVNLSSYNVHAYLQDASGKDYVLVKTTKTQLLNSGKAYEVIDEITASEEKKYIIALERIKGARDKAAAGFKVLLDDGKNIILKLTKSESLKLANLGFEIEWLSESPLVFKSTVSKMALSATKLATAYDPTVAEMIGLVDQTKVYDYTSKLTGEESVVIGGSSYTITTRHTNSGTPLEKATQYVYEFMGNLGLSVNYHNWTYWGTSNRNVIAEKTGTVSPNEIVLVTAHLDSLPSGSLAPGADDNSSGSVGLMIAAEIMKQYDFERTVRFVFFTGEEQGLYGSKRYADKVASDSDNIVAVYNIDMIAWDDVGGPTLRLHTRSSDNPGYSGDMVLANTFVDVVNNYSMSSVLTPIIDSDGVTASDHSPFWNKGYSAILAIEDDVDDFCDNYHTTNDKLSTLNMTYYTNYIKASVGTIAHLTKVASEPELTAAFSFAANLLEVTFTGQSTVPSGSTIVSRLWNFGDSSTSSLQNPVHTYPSAGTYTVTLTVEDNNGNTNVATKSIEVKAVNEYCISSGNSNNYEWISEVQVGSFSKTSGASGYSDFTTPAISLSTGNQTVTLTPGFNGSSYSEYWKVWIDFNNDGDFDDSGEEVFSQSGKSSVSGQITIPSSITGERRMRVSMRYNQYSSSCGTFDYGEVEDYTISIQ